MRNISKSEIIKLQQNVDNIRNICVLAHVDHGLHYLNNTLIHLFLTKLLVNQ